MEIGNREKLEYGGWRDRGMGQRVEGVEEVRMRVEGQGHGRGGGETAGVHAIHETGSPIRVNF
jgi:hypothetical protein